MGLLFNKRASQNKINKLMQLKKYFIEHESEILKIVCTNTNLKEKEIYITGVGYVKKEIKMLIDTIKNDEKKSKIKLGSLNNAANSYRFLKEKGNVLICSENNNFFSIFTHIIYSYINNNKTFVYFLYKHNVFDYFNKIISEIFDKEEIVFLNDLTFKNKKENFDFIFYTGFEENSKFIVKYATNSDISIHLDLYKNDICVLDKDIDITSVCKKLTWSKLLNIGQNNYTFVDLYVNKYNRFEIVKQLKKHFDDKYKEEFLNDSYPFILSEIGFNALVKYIKDADILYGGKYNSITRQVTPTIVLNTKVKSEFFGPIINIIDYENIEEIISRIKKDDNLYLFSNNEKNIDYILDHYKKNIVINDISVERLDENYNYFKYKDVFNTNQIIIHKQDKLFNDLRLDENNLKKIKQYFD